MKNLIFSISLMIVVIGLYAQSESNPRIKISDVMIQGGFQNYNRFNLDIADFNLLAPGNSYLVNNFSDYSRSMGMHDQGGMFSVTIGLSFLDAEKQTYKANPILRVGIYNARTSPASIYYSRQQSYAYDTLTSSATGQQYFIDSIACSSYDMNYNSEHLGLTLSAQFSTDPERRVSLFAGVGMVAAFSFNSHTTISNSEYSILSSDDVVYNEYPQISGDWNFSAEGYSNKTSSMISAGIPLGIDFRIAKANPFWSQIHLVYEIKPSVCSVTIPELKSYTSTGITSTMGLRVAW